MNSNLLTSSRLKAARSCKRKHRIAYELGYRPATEAEELFFGALLHLALEAWWKAVQLALVPDEWLGRALAALSAERADPFVLAKAQVMIMGYHARWESEAAHFEVLGVEEQFECDIINPETGAPSRTWRLGGRLDVRVRDRRDNLVKFIEHKSSSEDVAPGTPYWRRLRMDGQVSVYFDGCEALGTPAAACIYDVLGKPRLHPGNVPLTDEHGNKIVLDAKGERVRTAQGKWRQTGDTAQGYVVQTRPETVDEYKARLVEAITAEPDRYYARGEVVRLEQELRDARFDIWSMGKELRENELAGRAQRNPDACESYGRMCPYFDVCSGVASLDDPTRFRKVEHLHPELAGATSSDSEQRPKEVGT
jgi:hypothetical protein